jgi:hypothetical protein
MLRHKGRVLLHLVLGKQRVDEAAWWSVSGQLGGTAPPSRDPVGLDRTGLLRLIEKSFDAEAYASALTSKWDSKNKRVLCKSLEAVKGISTI